MAFKRTGDGGNGGGAAPADMDAFIFDKWGPFASDQGFVANQAPIVGTAPNREYWTWQNTVGSPQAPHCFMRTKDDTLFMFTGHTSVDTSGAQEVFDQPNNPANAPASIAYASENTAINASSRDCPIVNNADGPWSGHNLYSNANGDYIHAVCQLSARSYRHFWYGVLPDANKAGTWTGGTYMLGHAWDRQAANIDNPYNTIHQVLGCNARHNNHHAPFMGAIHCEGLVSGVDWLTPNWSTGGSGQRNTFSKAVGDVNNSNYDLGRCYFTSIGQGLPGYTLWQIGRSFINSATPLLPIEIYGIYERNSVAEACYLGTVPDVFRVNMRGLTPGDSITVGSDTYHVYPLVNSDTVNTVADEEYSGYEGLAYKAIT